MTESQSPWRLVVRTTEAEDEWTLTTKPEVTFCDSRGQQMSAPNATALKFADEGGMEIVVTLKSLIAWSMFPKK